ncbi:ABC transporter ATP-binding protein [Propioniciclava coleopterorum]|uniref:ABC transporter ATP-binding protein n=1 Tax=Propioniciclava coleopterorum TaxID=2714937 RepID=A0A6G7YAJ7_9ACTN|nr:ABC transporter ATP-binding protein [Propioniciclava coleopterorum]QIK73637.1 ABC transporter ATP-binding protein [Propioniciclava coleopterorum]
MADIQINNLVKVYPGSTERANDDVSMTIADGQFMVLLGPSGCGKTTLLRQIAGLELPTSGSIAIGGRDVTYMPVHQRNLSMVFQSYAVFPHRRVRHNIAFPLKTKKLPQAEIDKKVAWAADLLQLTPYLDRFPAQLSGGQRQRVAVARAIVVDADVLLMDEPLSNLDALLRLSFRSELKRIVEQLGTTTVYVTHDQSEALSLGDQVAVMRSGKVSQLAPPLDIYDHPSDTFVGGFIGSPPMNFLDGQATETGIDIGGHTVAAPAGLPRGKVRVGIRAEAIDVAPHGTPGTVPAQVLVVEPLGASTLLSVAIGEHQLKVQADPDISVKTGDTVSLRLAEKAIRLFDHETRLAWQAQAVR